ncbi:MAG: TlpA family protein disulfide reductase [Alcanivoracaceae bacterium]
MRRLTILLALLPTLLQAAVWEAGQFSPSHYPDAKVIYVDFWASWCVPCRQSFPWLNAMQEKYGAAGLKVVGINVDRQQHAANRFLEQHPAHFTLFSDPQGALAAQYRLEGMPSALLLSPDGTVLERHIGFRADRVAEYEAALQRRLAGGR